MKNAVDIERFTITAGQLRSALKDAFFAGFDAARSKRVSDAWEESMLRKDIDYHGLLLRMHEEAKTR